MALSVFDLFKVGIEPSSSHTVGPMVAACRFLESLEANKITEQVSNINIDLFGSLAMTGEGHGSDTAIMLGLMGEKPNLIDPDRIEVIIAKVDNTNSLALAGRVPIHFDRAANLIFNKGATLPLHANGIIFRAFDRHNQPLQKECYFSVGGGFVLSEE